MSSTISSSPTNSGKGFNIKSSVSFSEIQFKKFIQEEEKRKKSIVTDDEVLTTKQKVWNFVDNPSSSRYAQLFGLMILVTIFISCTAFCIETLPVFHRKNESVWNAVEAVCIALFTVEYVLRLFSCPHLWKFMKGLFNMIDLIAIVPFYIELMMTDVEGGASAVFRVVRLVRIFRIFKISRYLSWVGIFTKSLVVSAQPLSMLIFVVMVGCIFFSSGMYYAERGVWDPESKMYYRSDGLPSPYQSIPACFWWSIITMTTVGYGDDVPITTVGKLIATVTSLTGVLVLAIPITVISTNFNDQYKQIKIKKDASRARMVLLKNHFKHKSGLDAMNSEIQEVCKRSQATMMKEIEVLVDESRKEMEIEIQQLVKMAYEDRVKEIRLKLKRDQDSEKKSMEIPGARSVKNIANRVRRASQRISGKSIKATKSAKVGVDKPTGVKELD